MELVVIVGLTRLPEPSDLSALLLASFSDSGLLEMSPVPSAYQSDEPNASVILIVTLFQIVNLGLEKRGYFLRQISS